MNVAKAKWKLAFQTVRYSRRQYFHAFDFYVYCLSFPELLSLSTAEVCERSSRNEPRKIFQSNHDTSILKSKALSLKMYVQIADK